MPKDKSVEDVYESCIADNLIKEISDFEPQKVKDLLENGEIYQEGAIDRAKGLCKDDKKWMLVFVDWYDALRLYSEALVHLDKKKITNHQCLFAYICTKYSHLELNWGFLERIRTMRNGVNYYGQKITYEIWKKVELQITLYARTIKKVVEGRIF
jgi:hypothetical protein